MQYDAAHALARAIRESEEYQLYHSLKEKVMENETNAALIREYRKLQLRLQMAAAAGQTPDAEDMQRFTQLSSLLYADPRTSGYLLAQIRLQKTVSDILQLITEAAEMNLELPGLSE